MPRAGVHVRTATAADLPALLALDGEVREVPGKEGGRAIREARYAEVLADPLRRVVIAEAEDGDVLGMALLVRTSASALLDLPAVHLSHFVVADRHRGADAGRPPRSGSGAPQAGRAGRWPRSGRAAPSRGPRRPPPRR